MLKTVYSLVDGSLFLAKVEVFDPPICLLVLALYNGSPADQRSVQLFDDLLLLANPTSHFLFLFFDHAFPRFLVSFGHSYHFFHRVFHYFDCGTFLQMRL